jgi:hypothetical protein
MIQHTGPAKLAQDRRHRCGFGGISQKMTDSAIGDGQDLISIVLCGTVQVRVFQAEVQDVQVARGGHEE